MILVAGGQFDFNIGTLLRRILDRRIKFVEVLIGPDLTPAITLDLARDELRLNGQPIRPTSCFMRHDVFLQQRSKSRHAAAAAHNWYNTIKGWELAHDDVKGFNKLSFARENTKLQNLYLAKRHGLAVPETLVTNEFARAGARLAGSLIQKPVSGGEYTTTLRSFRKGLDANDPVARYPRFVQAKLARPEMRVYRIGDEFFAFLLECRDVDYRERNRVRLALAKVPAAIQSKLGALTDDLGLDFAAADFMRNKHGAYCFLEVNTQPMFAAFDAVAGGRLCDAIIDHLTAPIRRARARRRAGASP